jgi:ribosomal protein L9
LFEKKENNFRPVKGSETKLVLTAAKEKHMKEKDVFDEIIEIGKKYGSITYAEINDAISSDIFSLDRLVSLMNRLRRLGVRVIDDCSALGKCL